MAAVVMTFAYLIDASKNAGALQQQERPGQPTTGYHSGDRADHRHGCE